MRRFSDALPSGHGLELHNSMVVEELLGQSPLYDTSLSPPPSGNQVKSILKSYLSAYAHHTNPSNNAAMSSYIVPLKATNIR